MKKALVFGGHGQAGSYLVELLEGKGYQVSAPNRDAIDFKNTELWIALGDRIRFFQPDEIYNFAAMMYAPDSWLRPMDYMQVNGTAVLQILNEIRRWCPKTKFFNAGSADVFDRDTYVQDEDTKRKPRNPYGIAKLMAEESVKLYRENGLFACTGIMFNIESPRRKERFFSTKVIRGACHFRDTKEKIQMGNLGAYRDWGWAQEYAEVAWKMLQQKVPEDFVIGTGETHSCLEFVEEALRNCGLVGPIENFVEYESLTSLVPDCMQANPAKVKNKLGWVAKHKFKDVVRLLVEAEVGQSTVA